MTIWKQRLLARYHKPADGEGGDLGGGSATSAALDALSEGGGEQSTDQADDQPADTSTESADAAAGDDEQPQGQGEARDPQAKLASFLDTLSDTPAATTEKPAEPAAAAKPEDKPEAAKPGDKPAEKPADADKEEAELLQGVNSERGKERVRAVFQENKTLKTEIEDFKTLVQSTGMSAEQFASTLQFGRLVSSGTPENLQLAADMLEQQRAQLYAAMGKEAPGVDLLADFPDLKQQVDNLEMTREGAVELAKHRRIERAQTQQREQQRAAAEEHETFKKTINDAAATVGAYLETRKGEADHQARMDALGLKFKNPEFMQTFVKTYKPEQWVNTLRIMYDSVQPAQAAAPAAPRTPTPQPIRSRTAALGTRAPSANEAPIDRVASRLDALGI